MIWSDSVVSETPMDETLRFDPQDQGHWDEEQASLHAKTTYVKVVQWAKGEIASTGRDPETMRWLSSG